MLENISIIIIIIILLGLYLTFCYFLGKITWTLLRTLLITIRPCQARRFIDDLINLSDIKNNKDKDKIREILMFEYKYYNLDTYKDIENKFKELTKGYDIR